MGGKKLGILNNIEHKKNVYFGYLKHNDKTDCLMLANDRNRKYEYG